MNKLILSLFSVICLQAFIAQNQNIRFDFYSVADGLTQSRINDIAQDSRGYLWIATQSGLNRFDGYIFNNYYKINGDTNSLSNISINKVDCLNDTTIVATNNGLNIYIPDKENFFRVPWFNGFKIYDIDKAGKNLWLTTNKGLYKQETSFTKKATLVHAATQEFFYENKTVFIFTKNKKLFRLIDEKFVQEIILPDGVLVQDIKSFSNKKFIVATTEGVFIYDKNNNDLTPLEEYIDIEDSIFRSNTSCILVIDSTNFWFGTQNQGLVNIQELNKKFFINKQQFQQDRNYGISSNKIFALFRDFSGNIFIGTDIGLNVFNSNNQIFSHYKKGADDVNSLSSNHVWTIESDTANFYFGTDKGLSIYNWRKRIVNNYYKETNNINYVGNTRLYDILLDTNKNKIYTSFVDGFFEFTSDYKFKKIYDFKSNNILVYNTEKTEDSYILATNKGITILNRKTLKPILENSKPKGVYQKESFTRSLFVENDTVFWAGFEGEGLFKITIKNKKLVYDKIKGLDKLYIFDITKIGSDLWLGTQGEGLIKYNLITESIQRYTEEDGLPNNVVYSIEFERGFIWASTNNGLSRFDIKNEVFKNFYREDGLQENEFNINASEKTLKGSLLFGGVNGITSFNPRKVEVNTSVPKINIEHFKVNGIQQIISDSLLKLQNTNSENRFLKLKYTQNNISIDFSGIHFSNPAKNAYKYMLEGLDDHLSPTTYQRKVYFQNLEPGQYTFVLYASNSDEHWTETPLKISFIINPPFYKTWWFISSLSFVIAFSVYYYIRQRFKSIKEQKRKLEYLVQKRTKEVRTQKDEIESQKTAIEDEKEKLDEILFHLLPNEVVTELKNTGKSQARSYSLATVLFTDIVAFTRKSESLSPSELVEKLEMMFNAFDQISSKYQLERIKTIGDSYMGVGGIPIRSKSNPIYAVLASMEMIRYMDRFNELYEHKDPWEIRVGLNSGEITAGIIGAKRLSYDVWGNTVNLASRIETNGQASKINISENTYQHIKPFFNCTYRGKVLAKNVGYVNMYFVDSIKEELAIEGNGFEPNDRFFDYVNLYMFSSINYTRAENYIIQYLTNNLPKNLYYHNVEHTLDVLEATEKLALMEGIKGEDIFLLKTAALYHDSGFVEQYGQNEPEGVNLAKKILPQFGYSKKQVQKIANLIYATSIPHNPKTKLEEIICDADLDYLGRNDFEEIAEYLFKELKEREFIANRKQWDMLQVDFLTKHKYFTKSSIRLRKEKKDQNLQKVKDRLAKDDYVD